MSEQDNVSQKLDKKAKVEKKKKAQPQKRQKQLEPEESQPKTNNQQDSDQDSKDSDKSVESIAKKKVTEQKKKGGKGKIDLVKEKEKKGAPKQKTKERKKGAKLVIVKNPLIKEDVDSLLQYMKEMNRPYTLNYLKDTLFLKVIPLTKNLEILQKNNEIILKEVGNSKVFLINQANLPEVDKKEMEYLGKQLDLKTDTLKILNNEVSKGSEQLRQIHRILKINEVEDEIAKYKNQEVQEKMQFYDSSQFTRASESEVNDAEMEFKNIQDISIKRKKMYMRAIDTLLEGSEMTVQEFEAIAGIFRD